MQTCIKNLEQTGNSASSQKLISKMSRDLLYLCFSEHLHRPFISPILQKRWIVLILTGAAALQIWITALGFQGWQCPIYSTLGIPCPGCGLSTATVLLIEGDWLNAMHTHAFSPVFFIGLILIGIFGILPSRFHHKALRRITVIEKRTGFAAYILLGIVAYWGLRLFGLL